MTGSVDAQSGAVKAGPATLSGSAGAALRAAREAAGLPLDAIAQQLKLAPRQVQALEDDDYQHLPGRTFVRGFARNYARFVHLDPDAVLALLPAGEAAPALERPTLAPTRRPMGELPIEGVAKRSAIRWLIPLLLLIVAAAGYYEYTRQQAALRGNAATAPTGAAPPPPASDAAPDARGAPADGATRAAPATPGTRSTPLPNPLAGSPPAPAAPDPETAGRPQSPAPAAPGAGTVPGTRGSASANDKAVASGVALVLAFKGRSWVEVRDANGRIVLRSTETAGTTRTVAIAPPLELALGNARQVDATFRGQPLDLGPYTRGNVARVSLK